MKYTSFNQAMEIARQGSPVLQKLEELRRHGGNRFVREKEDPNERYVKVGSNTYDREENYTINGYPSTKFDWNK